MLNKGGGVKEMMDKWGWLGKSCIFAISYIKEVKGNRDEDKTS